MIETATARSHHGNCGRFHRTFLIALIDCLLLFCGVTAHAADPATVTFSLDFPNSDPDHYSIIVQSDGHARYECSAKISESSDERETYETEFTFSDATRSRIFDLTARAHFLSGTVD